MPVPSPLNLSKLPDSVPVAERPTAKQLVKVLRQRSHAAYSPFNVWIDQAGLVRQCKMSFTESVQGHSIDITLTQRFNSYGPQPAPKIPSASQTADLLSLAHASGG